MVGERLVQLGLITTAQREHALEVQKSEPGEFFGHLLIRLGYINTKTLGGVLQELTGIPFVELSDYPISDEALRLLPESMVREKLVLPVKTDAQQIWLAMVDALDLDTIDAIRLMTGKHVIPLLVLRPDLLAVVNREFDGRERAEQALRELEGMEEDNQTERELLDQAEEVPIVRLVNTVLDGAFMAGASDIHLEPQGNELRIRYRVDGMLSEQMTAPRSSQDAIISRIKIMGSMDIAERRRPQDGRITRTFQKQAFDLRVSTMPTVFGEKVVMRVLDKTAMSASLEQIGFLADELETWLHLIHRPYGMLLVTGPTGSGKSTTLYASLNKINDPSKNISTVEDPVEYQLRGINQTQVNARAGVTFATGLRTLVRQDPDIILVGEIRDRETAEVAVNAALTGHLVFATLHTNDAPGAIVRLDNMGIEPFLITSSVLGIVGQRLVRRICEDCKEWYEPDPALRDSLGLPALDDAGQPIMLARGVGCRECRQKGFRGRVAVFEVMVVTDTVRAMVLRRDSSFQVRDQAIRDGMRPMRQSALKKVLMGITTPEEVARVLLDID